MIEKIHPTYAKLKEHYLNFCNTRWIDEQKHKSETTPPGQSAYAAPVAKREVPAYVD
jgi:hypothetical protein